MQRGLWIGAALAALATGVAAEEAGLPDLEAEVGPAEVTLSGQVNLGVLRYRDGVEARTWAPVDNDNASSRVGVEAVLPRGDFEFTARAEVEYQPRPSDAVSIAEPAGTDWTFGRGNIRLLEVGVEHARYGRLWLGQGDMASEDVVEDHDLSGTEVAAQAGVQAVAGAQVFRFGDGGASGVRVGDAFDDYNGLGRAVRVRYDTPEWQGVRVSAAYGQDRLVGRARADLVDLGVTWEAERGEAEWAGAAGIGWEGGERLVAGMVSGLHTPTGVSLALAAGDERGRYGWAKLGWQRDLVAFGRTHVSVDRWRGSDIGAAGSSSRSWGVALVQAVDAIDSELWLLWRRYAYDEPAADFRAGHAVFGGVRVRF